MKKTRRAFARVWDAKLARVIDASFDKFESEVTEHSGLMAWVATRVLLPAAVFYVLAGVVFGQNVFDSLFLGLLVFVYSNFVPDLDSLLVVPHGAKRTAWSLEQYALLFFGPLFVYYAVSGAVKPITAAKPKAFHNARTLATYALFLLAVSLVFYSNNVERVSLPLFGALGFATHLIVDGYVVLPHVKPRSRAQEHQP